LSIARAGRRIGHLYLDFQSQANVELGVDPIGDPLMRFTVVLEREDDGGYVVSVPALPGCFTQGDIREEALTNVREAIEVYVEDCREAGDPVPTEAGKEFVEVEAA
jgi:antitoxin HicB